MFALSSKLYSYCEELMRLIYLNTLLVVFSLPVITSGGALVAVMEASRHPTRSLMRTFIRSFKTHFFKSIVIMGFSLCSYLFLQHLAAFLGALPFANILNFLIMSLLLVYNLNCYLLVSVLQERGIEFFRQVFYFTLGTFYKTFFFLFIAIGLTFLLSIVLGLFMFLLMFSILIVLYIKLVTKELNQVEIYQQEDRP